jgi:hypothetical protein
MTGGGTNGPRVLGKRAVTAVADYMSRSGLTTSTGEGRRRIVVLLGCVGGVLLLFLVIRFAFFGAPGRRHLVGPREKVIVADWVRSINADPSAAEEVSILQFLTDINKNEISGGEKWAGKKIRLAGVVKEVTSEDGFPCVVLWPGDYLDEGHSRVLCIFEKNSEAVRRLAQNQTVFVEGMLARLEFGEPLLVCRGASTKR